MNDLVHGRGNFNSSSLADQLIKALRIKFLPNWANASLTGLKNAQSNGNAISVPDSFMQLEASLALHKPLIQSLLQLDDVQTRSRLIAYLAQLQSNP